MEDAACGEDKARIFLSFALFRLYTLTFGPTFTTQGKRRIPVSASTSFKRTITVGMQYNPDCCLFALTSAELPGLLLAGKDPAKLWADVAATVKAMYRVAYDMHVDVVMEAIPVAETPEQPFTRLQPTTLFKVEPSAIAH